MTSNRSRRAYPPEFRQQVVELYHAGRSTTELAQDFGPHPQSIRNWVAWAKRDAGDASAGKESLTQSEREELNRLRRENRQLRLDRDILSKAAAWFARETNSIPPKDSDS
jgi:transposase